ncbi:MAG TPA: bifunctional DNA primase/polymerase [Kribbella sp.]
MYADKGYHPIPVKPGTKEPARTGISGHRGTDLTGSEIEQYAGAESAYNIGIRLPVGVVGIDVDRYAEDKHAAETMEGWTVYTVRSRLPSTSRRGQTDLASGCTG